MAPNHQQKAFFRSLSTLHYSNTPLSFSRRSPGARYSPSTAPMTPSSSMPMTMLPMPPPLPFGGEVNASCNIINNRRRSRLLRRTSQDVEVVTPRRRANVDGISSCKNRSNSKAGARKPFPPPPPPRVVVDQDQEREQEPHQIQQSQTRCMPPPPPPRVKAGIRKDNDNCLPSSVRKPSRPFSRDGTLSTQESSLHDPRPPQQKHQGFRKDYFLGKNAVSSSHMMIDSSLDASFPSASLLKDHDFAFVKRSNGQWTYAILAYRTEGTTEECLTFVMNHEGSTKMIKKKHWRDCIRLVAAVDEDDVTYVTVPAQRNDHQEYNQTQRQLLQQQNDGNHNDNENPYVVQHDNYGLPTSVAVPFNFNDDDDCSIISDVSARKPMFVKTHTKHNSLGLCHFPLETH